VNGTGRPVRFVLVGTGAKGLNWCKIDFPHLLRVGKGEVVALVDISRDRLETAREVLDLPPERCYTDLAVALADNEADAITVVVPPEGHEAVVDTGLAHGLHILSEKPIADSMEASCRVAAKVRAAGRKMCVTMSHRFAQDKLSLEARVRSGEYGRLNYIVQRFTHNCREFGSWGGDFRHRMPDPLLIEGSIHHFEMHRALAGANAATIYARSWNPAWGEYAGDSTAVALVEMTNGVHVVYEGAKANAATLNGWGNDYLRAECELGTLELDSRRLRVLHGGPWEPPESKELPLLSGDVWSNSMLAEMFCDWVDGRRDDHPTDVDDNLQTTAVVFAAIESARSGAPVDVQEFLRRHVANATGAEPPPAGS
jgi:predicted dehydrogenase